MISKTSINKGFLKKMKKNLKKMKKVVDMGVGI